jgi:hypothetical protein
VAGPGRAAGSDVGRPHGPSRLNHVVTCACIGGEGPTETSAVLRGTQARRGRRGWRPAAACATRVCSKGGGGRRRKGGGVGWGRGGLGRRRRRKIRGAVRERALGAERAAAGRQEVPAEPCLVPGRQRCGLAAAASLKLRGAVRKRTLGAVLAGAGGEVGAQLGLEPGGGNGVGAGDFFHHHSCAPHRHGSIFCDSCSFYSLGSGCV